MNKIEEILIEYINGDKSKGFTERYAIMEAMKKFGKLAFEAGRLEIINSNLDIDDDTTYSIKKYETYEDYLKKIENEL